MIRFSEGYVKLVEEGLEAGRFISIAAAEWFSGLPSGWTSPEPGSVNPDHVRSLLPGAGKAHILLFRSMFFQCWPLCQSLSGARCPMTG